MTLRATFENIYSIKVTEEEDNRICNRRETFIRETGTKKTVLITMITSYGLALGDRIRIIKVDVDKNRIKV